MCPNFDIYVFIAKVHEDLRFRKLITISKILRHNHTNLTLVGAWTYLLHRCESNISLFSIWCINSVKFPLNIPDKEQISDTEKKIMTIFYARFDTSDDTTNYKKL
jgi:hypothetical protein